MNRIIPNFTHKQIEYIRYLISANPCKVRPGSGCFVYSTLPEVINQMERDLLVTSSLDIIRSGKMLLKISNPKDIERVDLYEKLEEENFRNELLHSVYRNNELYSSQLVETLRKMDEEDLNSKIISLKNEMTVLEHINSFFGRNERIEKIEDTKKEIETYLFMKDFNKKANNVKEKLKRIEIEIKKMVLK